MRFTSALILASLLLSSDAAAGEASALTPGAHTIPMRHDGRARSYVVHVPRAVVERSPLPVVLSFHGGGGTAEHQQRTTRLHELGARERFIVVYPNGEGVFEGALLTWNAGTCCAYSVEQNVDDVGFVAALLDDLASRTAIDRARVYATGFSNGAMMAHRLAAERPDLVAAIAPVAGSMVYESAEPRAPVPVMHIHSVDDPRALYAGGLAPPFPGTDNRVEHPPVDVSLARWAKANGCAAEGQVVETRTRGTDTAEKISFAPCASGAALVHWKLRGPGHVWPGGEPTRRQRLTGPATSVIDANEEIWRFFRSVSSRR